MKTQTKLIALVAVAAIAAGAAFGILQRAEVPQARFVALSGASFSTADLAQVRAARLRDGGGGDAL